jgi:hypothetical protein
MSCYLFLASCTNTFWLNSTMWYLLMANGACQDADGDLLPSVLDALNEVQIKELLLYLRCFP